jgi:hypothetical protein
MTNLRWKVKSCVGPVVGVALLFPNLTIPSRKPATRLEQLNRVVIEYVRPQNPSLQDLYDALKIYGALEKIQKNSLKPYCIQKAER